jgi:hypothetical protein
MGRLGRGGRAPLSRDTALGKRRDGAAHSGAQQRALLGGERAAVVVPVSRPRRAKRRGAPRNVGTLGAPAWDFICHALDGLGVHDAVRLHI